MSAGMDVLDQIAQRLQRIEANQTAIANEIRRLSTIVGELVATPCARCRLQICDTLPADPEPEEQQQ